MEGEGQLEQKNRCPIYEHNHNSPETGSQCLSTVSRSFVSCSKKVIIVTLLKHSYKLANEGFGAKYVQLHN